MNSNTGSAYAVELIADAVENLTAFISKAQITNPSAMVHISHTLADLDDALTYIPYGDSEVPEALRKRMLAPKQRQNDFAIQMAPEAPTVVPEPIQQNEVPVAPFAPVVNLKAPQHDSYKVPQFTDKEHQIFDVDDEHAIVKDINSRYDEQRLDFIPDEERELSFDDIPNETSTDEPNLDEQVETMLDNSVNIKETVVDEFDATPYLDDTYDNEDVFDDYDELTETESTTIDFNATESAESKQPEMDEDYYDVNDFWSPEELDELEAMWGVSEEEISEIESTSSILNEQHTPYSSHPQANAAEDQSIIEGIWQETDD